MDRVNRLVFMALAVLVLVSAPIVTPVAQAASPVTLRVVIGGNNTLAPALFRVEKGALVRLIIENRSNEAHGLVSNQTQDAVFTKPGEIKVLEFKVTELPLTFACTVKGHSEVFTLEPPKR